MDKEAVLFTKPEELIEYLDENDLLMDLSSKDSEILLNYMEGHGYSLGELDGKLVRVDIGEEHGEVVITSYSIHYTKLYEDGKFKERFRLIEIC